MAGPSQVASVFSASEKQLWVEFERSAIVQHAGEKGSFREDGVARFLRSHLPGRYGIVKGELLDSGGRSSNQIDVLVFDKNRSAPLLRGSGNKGWVLPAEAALAVIEVKSRLTRSEMQSIAKGVRALHELRPRGDSFHVVESERERLTAPNGPRVHTSVLAFTTDLGAATWPEKEILRCRSALAEVGARSVELDRVVVLQRGMLNLASGKALETGESGALIEWFFTLMNFLERESSRREPLSFDRYRPEVEASWKRAVQDDFPGSAERRAMRARVSRVAPALKSRLLSSSRPSER